jgi:hypothetical protein
VLQGTPQLEKHPVYLLVNLMYCFVAKTEPLQSAGLNKYHYYPIPPPPGGTAILPEYIHYYGYYYQVIVQCLST